MANVCLNYVEAFGESDAIVNLKDYLKRHDFHEVEVVSMQDLGIEKTNTAIEFTLETRWSPEKDWIEKISRDFSVLVECQYEECSSDIGGKFAYDKGELVYDVELSYLESKYHSLDWSDFIECEVVWRLDDAEPFDEFIAPFKEFCSDGEIEELEELFFEYANEN